MSAATVLAAAIASGTDRLSTHDCWICIAYLYANGNSAQTQLNLAIENGWDRIATTDLFRCIASILNGSSPPPPVLVFGSISPTTAASGVGLVPFVIIGSGFLTSGITQLDLHGGSVGLTIVSDIEIDVQFFKPNTPGVQPLRYSTDGTNFIATGLSVTYT